MWTDGKTRRDSFTPERAKPARSSGQPMGQLLQHACFSMISVWAQMPQRSTSKASAKQELSKLTLGHKHQLHKLHQTELVQQRWLGVMLHLQSICEEVGVRHAPAEGPELHDRNETCQIEHFPLHVLAILHPAEVEQLCTCTLTTPSVHSSAA